MSLEGSHLPQCHTHILSLSHPSYSTSSSPLPSYLMRISGDNISLSKLENKMLTNAPDCWFCKPSSWSDKTTISCTRHSVKPATLASSTKSVGRAGRSIGFGRVSEGVRTQGAVNTGEGQFQENWTGVHMKLWVRLEPRLRAGFCCTRSPWLRNSRRGRATVALLISGLAATCLHWDLVSPGPDMLWRKDVNPVRRLLTKFGYN